MSDAIYSERNHVVALLARHYPSGITKTDIPGWDSAWNNCVYIQLPSGQISYHYHDRDSYLFKGLPEFEGVWDGHNKEQVHRRIFQEILDWYPKK